MSNSSTKPLSQSVGNVGSNTSLLHEQIVVISSTTSSPAQQDGQDGSRWRGFKKVYEKNLGLLLILLAQVFGSLMTMATRLLETGFEEKYHALQIIFVRMFATSLFALLYMLHQKVPSAPFGDRKIRGLLVLRGSAGSVGLFFAYYALAYLSISDATVITFLTPILTAAICFMALGEPFTLMEGLGGIIAVTGVLFVARPTFLFPNDGVDGTSTMLIEDPQHGLLPPVTSTPTERSVAVILAVLGSFFAATAYSTIRIIGKRAHALVSVNYFATIATIGSGLILLVHPDLSFQLPQGPSQWALLTMIGLSGFSMQFLLTEGLQREKGGKATNLIYTQLVFALCLERIVWGTTPSGWSLIGGAMIIAGAILSSVQKGTTVIKVNEQPPADEESRLLENEHDTPSYQR
ncbi:hypothetical protein G7046_g4206 [Stylonectria norvegica]|nr:hypothetical protein G7046_g4206 [Stylonectria norvegica]